MLWGSANKNGKSNFIFSPPPPLFFISLCWPLTMFKLYGCSIFRLWNVQCFEMFRFPVMHSSFCFCYIKRITFPRTSFMYTWARVSQGSYGKNTSEDVCWSIQLHSVLLFQMFVTVVCILFHFLFAFSCLFVCCCFSYQVHVYTASCCWPSWISLLNRTGTEALAHILKRATSDR